MKSRLNYINDWPELARQANWSPAVLAKQCRVCLRTLERHFLRVMGKIPRVWLNEERMALAREQLADGSSVKETALMLGYKHATHFCRDFRRHCGHPPAETALPPSRGLRRVKCRDLVSNVAFWSFFSLHSGGGVVL